VDDQGSFREKKFIPLLQGIAKEEFFCIIRICMERAILISPLEPFSVQKGGRNALLNTIT
jgi:hypothetical protein